MAYRRRGRRPPSVRSACPGGRVRSRSAGRRVVDPAVQVRQRAEDVFLCQTAGIDCGMGDVSSTCNRQTSNRARVPSRPARLYCSIN